MARPKKSDVDEITAVNQDIEVQTEKLRKLREKQKRLQEADNIKLGKLVKSVFKDSLPATEKERKVFFTNLANMASQPYDSDMDIPVEESPVSGGSVVSVGIDAATPGQIVE